MRTFLERFHVGSGTTVGPVTVFPVWSEEEPFGGFTIPRPSNVQVAEQGRARVDQLQIQNGAREAILIAEGTIFDGGLQTRVVASDILLGAGASAGLDVRCVEQGRWHQGDRDQHVVDGRAPISVVAALRGLGNRGDAQSKVWRRVSQLQRSYGDSPTGSLLDLMAKEELNSRIDRRETAKARLGQARVIDPRMVREVKRLASKVLPGQTGVMIGIGGVPIALELHANPDLLKAQLRQLLGAALLDGVAITAMPTPGRLARRFAEEILSTPLSPLGINATSTTYEGVERHAHIRGIVANNNPARSLHVSVLNARHELALAA